ncbi:unnamed protein product [Leptidea sinapis]|uniref:THAP-type domain-containing protein n=1 Tax=Leptidea sinapis TaxID=189913 RepID=A0A5E4QCF6_9NEOP|nr:unnamed protein product [Leptidea sinapis]
MSNPNTRKSCAVPLCKSTTVNAPEKLFFVVPMDFQMRQKWIKAMKRLYPFGAKSKVFCCEDHFDIENDMENYIKYKLVGGRIKLKKGILPHKFKCQQECNDKPKKSAAKKPNEIKYFEEILCNDVEAIPSTSDAPKKPEEVFVACYEDDTVMEDP